jgi:hypothetical protein
LRRAIPDPVGAIRTELWQVRWCPGPLWRQTPLEQPTFSGSVSLAPFEQKLRNFDSRGHNEIHFLLGEPALIQPVPDKGFAGYRPRWFPDMSEFYRNSVPFSQLFPRSLL